MHQTKTEIARQAFDAIARGDFDAITELLDPEVKWHGGNPADGCQNRRQALAWIRGRGDRQAGPLPELVDVIEAGDRVVVIMQPPATDEEPAPQRTANLATFRDDRVVEMVHYDDAAAALQAAGVSGPPSP